MLNLNSKVRERMTSVIVAILGFVLWREITTSGAQHDNSTAERGRISRAVEKNRIQAETAIKEVQRTNDKAQQDRTGIADAQADHGELLNRLADRFGVDRLPTRKPASGASPR